MRFVKTLTSNFLAPNGEPWTFQLDRLTLITGANGAGKSMISHALRLSLKGETDDFGGKQGVKDPQALIALAPFSGDGSLFAHVTMDDGSQAAWGIHREAGTVGSKQHEAPGIDPSCCVLDAVRAALAGDERTARRYFLGWVARDQTDADVLARLPTHLHARYTEIATAKRKVSDGPKTPADALTAVVAHAQAEVRTLRTQADAADEQATALRMALGGVERPDDATLAQAEGVAAQWDAYWASAVAWAAWQNAGARDKASYLAEREGLVAAQTQAAAHATYWRERIVPAEVPVHPLAVTVLAPAIATGTAACPVCNSSPGALHLQAMHAYHAAQPAPGLSEAETSAAAWAKEEARLADAIKVLDALIEKAPDDAPPFVDAEPDVAKQHRDTAHQHAQTLRNARARTDALKPATDRAAAIRTQIPAWEDLVTHATVAVKDMLVAGQDAFAARVQTYVPDMWTFSLKLVDPESPEKEVFQVALSHPHGASGYMSGTQRDALLVAIAMVVAEIGGGVPAGKKTKKKIAAVQGAPFFIVFPEDRSRDDDTLKALLRAWEAFPGQVIIENATKPSGKLPKGWTHIDLDEWRKSFAKVEETPSRYTAANESMADVLAGMIGPSSTRILLCPTAHAQYMAEAGDVPFNGVPVHLAPAETGIRVIEEFESPPLTPDQVEAVRHIASAHASAAPPAPALPAPPAVLTAPPAPASPPAPEAPASPPACNANTEEARELLILGWPHTDIHRFQRGAVEYILRFKLTPTTAKSKPDGSIVVSQRVTPPPLPQA